MAEPLRGRRRRNLEQFEPVATWGILQSLDADDPNPTTRRQRREARRALRDNPDLRRVVAARVQEEMEEAGEDTGSDRPILAFILKYLPWVIQLIISLQGGGSIPPFPG